MNNISVGIIPTKGIIESKVLNGLSKEFRKTPSYKRFVLKEGFELNPFDLKWEWIINFKNKSGFVVLNEKPSVVMMYVYKSKEDLDPKRLTITDIKITKSTTHKRFCSLMEQVMRLCGDDVL